MGGTDGEVERARRLAEVFGEVLPADTADDADEPGAAGEDDAAEQWLRENRPPHHDLA